MPKIYKLHNISKMNIHSNYLQNKKYRYKISSKTKINLKCLSEQERKI